MKDPISKLVKVALASSVVASTFCVSAQAAPILYIDDTAGNIGTVDVATGAAHVIGNTGHTLTDIAFDPSGNLYGISFSQLFRIDKSTAAATLVGNLGTSLNSLVFGSDGTLYGANNGLYKINTATGAATAISSGAGGYSYSSSGDLAFIGGQLFLSSGPGDNLVNIDTATGKGTLVGTIGYSSVFGLATDDNVNLYGLSGTRVLRIDPLTGQGTSLVDYAGQGLQDANGTAFIEEAQGPTPPVNVPEPATALLFGLGSIGMLFNRRRAKQ